MVSAGSRFLSWLRFLGMAALVTVAFLAYVSVPSGAAPRPAGQTGLVPEKIDARTAETAPDKGKIEALERSAAENRAKADDLAKKAEALQTQILALRSEMIATARRAQDFEENLSTIERTLNGLEAQERRMAVTLKDRRAQLTSTLGALQRIALQPPEAVFAAPGSPIDTVRSALLLQVAVPTIEQQAHDLRQKLVQLASLRDEIGSERAELHGAARDLEGERSVLSRLIERKNDLYEATRVERESAQIDAEQAARDAEDLRDLLARLEEESRQRAEEADRNANLASLAVQARQADAAGRAEADAQRQAQEAERAQVARLPDAPAAEPPAPEAIAPESTPSLDSEAGDRPAAALTKPVNVRAFPNGPDTAPLVMPARGRIVAVYGQRNQSGTVSKGISIATRNAAQIVAPYDGRVAYAGLFRRYGQILIIEHGGRYHTLLAGVDRIDAVVGQWVLAGEPIGVMADQSGITPELYLELRRTGQPINPLPWLAKTNDKVQG